MKFQKRLAAALAVVVIGESYARERMTDRTVFLCEIPLAIAYSNGNHWNGYTGRWTDGPLMIDRSLTYWEGQYGCVTWQDLWRTLDEMRLTGIDACTFNVSKRLLDESVRNCSLQGKTPVGMVPDYPPVERCDKLPGRKEDEPYFAPAFFNTNGVFVAGKPLSTAYWIFEASSESLKEKLGYIRQKYGDFWFVPQGGPSGYPVYQWVELLDQGKDISEEEREKLKESVRVQLRRTDGMIWSQYNNWTDVYDGTRSLNIEAVRKGPAKMVREVFEEPEFNGKKFLGVMVGMGHANPYSFGNRNSSNGTRTLRDMLSLAFEMTPDIVLFFEWNEWNENTGIAPSIWNSFAPRRIIRAMRAAYEHRPNEPLQGDDLSVPNLIISFPKTLSVGEVAQYELLTVPDRASKGMVTVELQLFDENDNLLKSFPAVTMDATKLEEKRLKCDSGDFGDALAIVPRLKVTSASGVRNFDAGLPFTEMRATGNWDHKWVLQPLRDLIPNVDLRIKQYGHADPDGKMSVAMKLDSPVEIDRLELLDGGDIVYSRTGKPNEEWREDKTSYIFSIMNVANLFTREHPHLEVKGVSEAEWLIGTNRTFGLTRRMVGQSVYTPDTYLKLRKDEARNARVKLTWPQVGEFEIGIDKVLDNGFYGVGGTNGLSFVINRFLRQAAFFAPVGTNRVTCSADIIPDLPVSVISAHAITADGKIFRSKPIVVGNRSGKKSTLRYWSECQQRVRSSEITCERIPMLDYEFSGDYTGTEVRSGFGRAFNGSLGGFTAASTLRNRGDNTRNHVCLEEARRRGFPSNAPVQEKADGMPTLTFDGSGTYFVMPGGTIPRYSAYRLSFEFRTDDPCRQQEIFACGLGNPAQWGIIGYLRLCRDGKLRGIALSEHYRDDAPFESQNAIDPNGWNRVELISRVDSLELILNGISAGRVRTLPPGRFDASCWFGGRKGELFKGQIRNVHVSHVVED